jgi:hypothetical protein
MKKMILLLALFLAACAPKHEVTNAMLNGMTVYGIWYGEMYPAETINVARECAIAQTGVYYSREQNLYMIACIIPSAPDSYGIVCMNENTVRSTFGINKDQGSIDDIMRGLGYEK